MGELETFQNYRPLLFAIAYRMLGSASDAEDVLQDAYIRWTTAAATPLQSPKAFLSTIVSRLCLDRLKSARAVREHYFGTWLPEPVLTIDGDTEMFQSLEQRESLSFAFLVLLESLTPQERAVFLLHEVFEYEYSEIAEMLQLSQPNCRQLFHRAKQRIAERRPRYTPTIEQQQLLLERFSAATGHGDIQALTALLAEDVLYQADGGGKVPSAARPVAGREAVIKLHLGVMRNVLGAEAERWSITVAPINGNLAFLAWLDQTLTTVMIPVITGQEITSILVVRNPDKLHYLQRQLQGHN